MEGSYYFHVIATQKNQYQAIFFQINIFFG